MTSPADVQQWRAWRGYDLAGPHGVKIGKIHEIYMDQDTGQPEWLAVSTGLFGSRVSFVPLAGVTADGDRLVTRWTKDEVKDAPHAEADGQLSEEEEARLYEHYGLGYSERRSDSGLLETGHPSGDVELRGGPSDSAMTRSEQELRVGTREEETGRVRLRKWVETEQVSETVPVQREQVRVEREPITDANREAALSGPEITESEHEVVLHEERPVVETETVPKERIRLEKDVTTQQQQVGGEVRKERVAVEGDGDVTDPASSER